MFIEGSFVSDNCVATVSKLVTMLSTGFRRTINLNVTQTYVKRLVHHKFAASYYLMCVAHGNTSK